MSRAPLLGIACLAALLPAAQLDAFTLQSVVFNDNGTDGTDGTVQSWRVPQGVTRVTVVAEGAAGGRSGFSSFGGPGAKVVGRIAVTPGEGSLVPAGGTLTDAVRERNGRVIIRYRIP